MSKYNDYDYNDEHDEEDFDRDDAERMAEEIVYNSKAARDAEVALATKSMNLDMMDMAIRVAKGTWLWWFLPHSSKLDRIEEAFEKIKSLAK